MEPTTTRRIARRWPWISAGLGLGLAIALGVLVVFRESPLTIDADWMDEIIQHRSPYWEVPALLMDRLGGGVIGIFVVPLGIVALLLLLRRKWAALFSIVAAAISAGVVQVLKNVVGRERPEDILVAADFGSFPSGHVANAATVAATFVLLFGLSRGRWWVWMLGSAWIVAMALSRTYLGAHWVTDTVGGALVGVAVAVIVWAPLASRLEREHESARRGGTRRRDPRLVPGIGPGSGERID
jgi:membrane-associated phospholipid phosphatase